MRLPDRPLTSGGIELDLRPEAFGELRDSNDLLGDVEALRARMAEDGYLLLRDFLPRQDVLRARRSIAEGLAERDLIDRSRPLDELGARPGRTTNFSPAVANANAELKELIYSDHVMAFYCEFLGDEARHYDYTWLRTVAPGPGTSPHMDVVYMGRGTRDLLTAWVPLGDVDLTLGGLIILEGSHLRTHLLGRYAEMDVDTACDNFDGRSELNAAGFDGFGAITYDPRELRDRFGGRWLTSEFRAGDFLTFSVVTVHASLDNAGDRIRLSSDSRYQRANDPIDERWIGENPPAHGGRMVKRMIC